MLKGLLIAGGVCAGMVVVLGLTVAMFGQPATDKATAGKARTSERDSVDRAWAEMDKAKPDTVDPAAVARENIAYLKTHRPELSDANSVLAELALLDVYAHAIGSGALDTKLRSRYKAAVVGWQKKHLPAMRKHWVNEVLYPVAWKNDIRVRVQGRTLFVTGGIFAANSNIAAFQETLSEMLHFLRFRQVQYRWYEDAERYESYTMDTPGDEAVKVMVFKK